MKKFIEKVTFNDSAASESPQGGAPGAEKKMPYEAPQVKVVEFQMERGFFVSRDGVDDMNASGRMETMSSGDGWLFGGANDHDASTETFSHGNGSDWGTFQ